MLVLDASCLFEVVTNGPGATTVAGRLAGDPDSVAPHIVDVEVFGVISRDLLRGQLDRTAAELALSELERWPGERFGHRALLRRAWELRHSVRGWDAMYVALAEALDSPLLTFDARLGAARGPHCDVVVLPYGDQ